MGVVNEKRCKKSIAKNKEKYKKYKFCYTFLKSIKSYKKYKFCYTFLYCVIKSIKSIKKYIKLSCQLFNNV